MFDLKIVLLAVWFVDILLSWRGFQKIPTILYGKCPILVQIDLKPFSKAWERIYIITSLEMLSDLVRVECGSSLIPPVDFFNLNNKI